MKKNKYLKQKLLIFLFALFAFLCGGIVQAETTDCSTVILPGIPCTALGIDDGVCVEGECKAKVLVGPLEGSAEESAEECPAGYERAASGICLPIVGLPDPNEGILGVVKNLLNWLLGIFGILALISFIVSGIQYLMSAGDKDMAEKAKKHMKYSIYGVLVALSGLIIITAIDAMFNANNTMF